MDIQDELDAAEEAGMFLGEWLDATREPRPIRFAWWWFPVAALFLYLLMA